MNDLSLRQNVIDELEFEPSVDARHIGVAVADGVVTLTGHVGSYAEKLAAEIAVKRISGVRGIAEEIQVRYPESKKTRDDEIAGRALKILDWRTDVPHGRIFVKVQDGWVTLTGDADWAYQKLDAEVAIRQLGGVVGISNLITVRPLLANREVKTRVEDALRRDRALKSDLIRVSVAGDTVTLDGAVRGWRERGLAERAAWSVPGVGAVRDHLAITW